MSSWLCPGIECRHPLADHIVGVTDDTLVCQVEGCTCSTVPQEAGAEDGPTDHELRRWEHLANKARGSAIGLNHDDAMEAMLWLIAEIQRLRTELVAYKATVEALEDLDRRPRVDRFRDLLAAAIGEKIVAEPALLDRAREVMDRGVWRSDYESQWRALVAAGPAAVIGVLTSRHPETLALKADSPFTMLGLADDAERQRLLEMSDEQDLVERLWVRIDADPTGRGYVEQMKDNLRLLGHLSWLDEQHGLLEGLYDWDHDAQGYRAGRTCSACGVRSSKHAQLDARHTADCHLRAVEDALGISQYGMSGTTLDQFVAEVEATSTDDERAELEAFRQWHRKRGGGDDA